VNGTTRHPDRFRFSKSNEAERVAMDIEGAHMALFADGTRTATVGNGDFGTSPIFGQLSDKPLLACIWLCGMSDVKNKWRVEKLRADPIR
jgi:hypothetical protein